MQPLLIDELGYLTIKPEQVNAFFRLMDQRYARVSTIITTNLELSDWYELFDKKPLVDALLDRLQHHCITIRIDGPSAAGQHCHRCTGTTSCLTRAEAHPHAHRAEEGSVSLARPFARPGPRRIARLRFTRPSSSAFPSGLADSPLDLPSQHELLRTRWVSFR